MSCQTNDEYLKYLVGLFTAASTAMEEFNARPEADRYLLALLTTPSAGNETIRGTAGLVLKNNMRRRAKVSHEMISFMQQCGVVEALGDPMPLVRGTVGTLLAAVAMQLGRELSIFWPQLLPTLLKLSASQEETRAVAASEALAKICEDASEELLMDPANPIPALVPQLIALLASDGPEAVRVATLTALNCFILLDSVLDAHLASILHVLSQQASTGGGGALRRVICQSLNLLMDAYPAEMRSVLPSVLDYMFINMQYHDDEAVALEACEFWLALTERDSTSEILLPVLPRLLKVLIENMRYTDDDPDLEANVEDTTPDRVEDIRPRHHRAALHKSELQLEEGQVPNEDDEDVETDEEEEEEEEEVSAWTLRKCSAATLDVLSSTMSESDIVPILLPLINENLVSDDWKHREVGILALGAIAEGCMDAIDPHLPQIIPFLLQSLQTPVPLVKAIAAWTLSRYASWIEHSRIHHNALNQAAMLALLHTMADRNKKVQRSACTALSVFGERAPETVAPQLEAIMQAVQWGLRSYQAKNLMVLYDAVGTIADGLGPERLIQLQRTNALQAILPALLEKWVNTAEDDIGLFALLECMCSLAVAMGSQMAPYAQVIVQRALSMVETTLKAAALTSGGDVDFDFCIVALDLIGGLVGGLGERMAPLLLADAHKFEALLTRCLDEPLAQVRQSALALVGDLAECCPAPLNSPTLLTVVIKAIIENVDAMQESASQGSANNAVWALGELLLCFPDMIKPHLTILLPRLCRYMQHYADNTVSRGYLENLAVTIGRAMALMPVAEFGEILGRWSTLMTHVVDQREKCSAWSPVMACLLANPMMIQPEALPKLLRSIAVFKDPPASMELAFKQLVVMCKEQLVGSMNWPQFRRTLEVPSEFDIRFGI